MKRACLNVQNAMGENITRRWQSETNPIMHSRFKSFTISPESCFESPLYTRRFGPNESAYISRFENRDLGRFHGIRRQNRLKRFQIENDSQKRGYHSWRSASQTRCPRALITGSFLEVHPRIFEIFFRTNTCRREHTSWPAHSGPPGPVPRHDPRPRN